MLSLQQPFKIAPIVEQVHTRVASGDNLPKAIDAVGGESRTGSPGREAGAKPICRVTSGITETLEEK